MPIPTFDEFLNENVNEAGKALSDGKKVPTIKNAIARFSDGEWELGPDDNAAIASHEDFQVKPDDKAKLEK